MNQQGTQILKDSFGQLSGLPCWGVKRGHGTSLTLEFGQPHLRIREPEVDPLAESLGKHRCVSVAGQHHLWLHLGDWEISYEGEQIASSNSEQDQIDRGTFLLDGQILTKFVQQRSPTESQFHFDLGGKLVIRKYIISAADEELWHFYSGDSVLSLLSSGILEYGAKDETSDESAKFECEPLIFAV